MFDQDAVIDHMEQVRKALHPIVQGLAFRLPEHQEAMVLALACGVAAAFATQHDLPEEASGDAADAVLEALRSWRLAYLARN